MSVRMRKQYLGVKNDIRNICGVELLKKILEAGRSESGADQTDKGINSAGAIRSLRF